MLVQLTRGSVASKIGEPLGTAPPSLSLPLKDLVFAGLNPSRRKGTIFIRAADVAVMNWVFRFIVPTDSGPSCPAIPVHRAHPFRSIVPSLTG